MQHIVLPTNFGGQTLTSIELVDNGAPGVQRVILDGVTVVTAAALVPQPIINIQTVNITSFLTNGLVAFYPLNGNANDASGRGHNGTIEGAVLTTNQYGSTNAAYYFDGTAVIDIPSSTDFDWYPEPGMTVSVWTFPSIYLYPEHLVGRRNDAYSSFWQLAIGPDALNGLPIGQWTHLVMTFDGSYNTYYTNGVPCQTNASIPGWEPVTNDVDVLIGGSAEYQKFVGNLDDVRIYSRELSTIEIQQLYAYESQPNVTLNEAVVPSFSNLVVGANYQLQVSGDLNTWTNQGAVFTATNPTSIYPQYFNVSNLNQLFFRLQVAP